MFSKILQSFRFAFNGILLLLKSERNFQIHFVAFFIVASFGFYFQIESFEWIAILGISALVLSLEALNTAIENLCDLYSKEQNPKIKLIKDISAGGVLIASVFAIVIGVIIFSKYINV